MKGTGRMTEKRAEEIGDISTEPSMMGTGRATDEREKENARKAF